MKMFTFKGGVQLPDFEHYTNEKKIEKIEPSKKLYIPLLQHIGTPCEPIVKVGSRVLKGEKIGEFKNGMAVPVHSPVSGTVTGIEIMPFPLSGNVKTIIIENDGMEETFDYPKHENYEMLAKGELIEIIREMGIVGQGGAAFPTYIKLNPPEDKKIDTLIINAAECEPYLNADNRNMIEEPEKTVSGIKIAMHVLGVKKAIIGIEDNKKEAFEIIKKEIGGSSGIIIQKVLTKYPQGGEKQLIWALTGRTVPSRKLPADIGVVVINSQTAKSIHDAVVDGIPLIERVLTVAGLGAAYPKNIKARIGTRFIEIMEYCGYDSQKTKKLIMGGPMMGIAQYSSDVPVIKGTSGILMLTDKEIKPYKPHSCISCGKCIDACPVGLLPVMFAKLGEFSEWAKMGEYKLMDCIECGACSYICPSCRPLSEAIKIGKAKQRTLGTNGGKK